DGAQVAEMDVEGAERRDDHEVRQDEGPAARPGAPEAGAQIGNIDADLDRERAGQRLADRDRLAHLLLGEPLLVGYELALHLTDQRDRPAEAEQAEAEEVGRHPGDRAALRLHPCRHRKSLVCWICGPPPSAPAMLHADVVLAPASLLRMGLHAGLMILAADIAAFRCRGRAARATPS